MLPSLLVYGLFLLWAFKDTYGQPPILDLTDIDGGCLVNGQSLVFAEGTANFTNRDTIGDWGNVVNFVIAGTTVCSITVNACPSATEECYCQKGSGEEYRLVMNQTADKVLSNASVFLNVARVIPTFEEHPSNLLSYPEIFDPVEETLLDGSSTEIDISSGILPDSITSVNYVVTGLDEPYSIKYSVSEQPVFTTINNTENVNINTNQRMLHLAYEELKAPCQRHAEHTLCRKGGIEEIVEFDGNVATNNTLPMDVANLDYTLSHIIEPYLVEVTITYGDTRPQANHTYHNTSNIQLPVNGSTQICISYEETGTGRLSQCLGQAQSCFSTAPTTEASTESSCPCDCEDWNEYYTIVPFVVMLFKVVFGSIVLLLYCKRETFPKWPPLALVLYIGMVVTVTVNMGLMCYQEINDCGFCDCQFAFILIELIVTAVAIFSIMFLLFKEQSEHFVQKGFRAGLLVIAVAMAVISIICIIVVFCNKEISGSGAESWHVIFLLIGIAMALIVTIGVIALFACQGSPVKHGLTSRNGKGCEKLELDESDGPKGKSNPVYDTGGVSPEDEKTNNHVNDSDNDPSQTQSAVDMYIYPDLTSM